MVNLDDLNKIFFFTTRQMTWQTEGSGRDQAKIRNIIINNYYCTNQAMEPSAPPSEYEY